MRLTERSNYAVLILTDIANNAGNNPVRAVDIAERQRLDQDYMYQVLRRLRVNGLVLSEKGPGGGYRLAKQPKDITMYDIFKAAETRVSYSEGLKKPDDDDTPEYGTLYNAMDFICTNINEGFLKETSLDQMLFIST